MCLFECVSQNEACWEFLNGNHCEFCGNSFQLHQTISSHVRIAHDRIINFECNKCNEVDRIELIICLGLEIFQTCGPISYTCRMIISILFMKNIAIVWLCILAWSMLRVCKWKPLWSLWQPFWTANYDKSLDDCAISKYEIFEFVCILRNWRDLFRVQGRCLTMKK